MTTGTTTPNKVDNSTIMAKLEAQIANFTNMLTQKRTAMEQIVAEINQINGAIHGFNTSLSELKNPTPIEPAPVAAHPAVAPMSPAANLTQEKNAS